MYAAGIQPILIELLMGHSGNGLVHTYAKADDDFKKDAVAKLEAFIALKAPGQKHHSNFYHMGELSSGSTSERVSRYDRLPPMWSLNHCLLKMSEL
jgi:hypothetical protein